MRQFVEAYQVKQLVLICCFFKLDGYISSLGLYQLHDTRVLVVGDCHSYGKDDIEHKVQLHEYFDELKRKKRELIVLLEGNYANTSRLSQVLTSELLLPATWLYGYYNRSSTVVFHFADPRVALHRLYKQFMRKFSLNELFRQSEEILEEYRTVIAKFTLDKVTITSLECRIMLEFVIRRITTALKTLELVIALPSTLQTQEELLYLSEVIIQSYVDIPDVSFCLQLCKLMLPGKKILVLVGEDHTARLTHMLELLGYRAIQSINACHTTARLPMPIALSQIDSYCLALFD